MEYTTIGESCSVVSGGTPSRSKTEYWRNGTIPWIKIGNIKSKYVNEYDELITEQGLNNSSAKLLKKGTILYLERLEYLILKLVPIKRLQESTLMIRE